MHTPSSIEFRAAERTIRKRVGLPVFSLVVLSWIGKLFEHAILSWFIERARDQERVVEFLKWSIQHPLYFTLLAGVVYCAIAFVTGVLGGEPEERREIEATATKAASVVEQYSTGANSPNLNIGTMSNSPILTGPVSLAAHSSPILHDPVIHIDPKPGSEIIECIGGQGGTGGNFVLTIVSTGLVNVTHVEIFLDLFLIQRINGTFRVKSVSVTRMRPDQTIANLSKDQPQEIPVAFSEYLPILIEISERSGKYGIPTLCGVRIEVRYRRENDGKQFGPEIVAYGMDPWGRNLMGSLPRVRFDNIESVFITLSDVMPLIINRQQWDSVRAVITGNPDGTQDRRYE